MSQKAREPLVIGIPEGDRAVPRRNVDAPWRVLLWVGIAILIVGVVDLLLVWYPVRADNPAWEFGAVDRSVSTAPVLLVALGFMAASGLHTGRRWVLALLAATGVAVALASIIGLFVYWTTVPLALSGTPEPVLPGIRKSMARTTAFGVVLLCVSATTAFVALRVAFTRGERRMT